MRVKPKNTGKVELEFSIDQGEDGDINFKVNGIIFAYFSSELPCLSMLPGTKAELMRKNVDTEKLEFMPNGAIRASQ